MFHKAVDLAFGEGTVVLLTFRDGQVKRFDMACLFDRYPKLRALENRELFTAGKLMGGYGIIWNDELDIEAEAIYEDGITVETVQLCLNQTAAEAVLAARAKAGLSQKQVSERAGIDQSDISRIERGLANPSVATLERIANALGGKLNISIVPGVRSVE